MKFQIVRAVAGVLLTACCVLPTGGAGAAGGHQRSKPGSCTPSPKPLRASAVRVPGFSTRQILNATAIINAGARMHVPQRGQTLAVMTALQASSLGSPSSGQSASVGTLGIFGVGSQSLPSESRVDPTRSAQHFYGALTKVKDWQNLTPTLAAHAAQHNLDPQVYARWWPKAGKLFMKLTSGTGPAALRNLAARAQAVANCEQATLRGLFARSSFAPFVGPLAPAVLQSRALEAAAHGGNGWFDRCQAFVALLDGRTSSGYATALDAWQTFQAEGVAHPVTARDGVAPPPGAWLYYSGTNPAGHVVTYLGNGQIASTDVFGIGRVGVGPSSAITDGPWHLQYLGWAPPWGGR